MRPHLLGILVLAGAVGCASSRSYSQSVPVITDPSGATAVAGNQRITTPGHLLVPRGAREMEIRIELAGYETEVVLLTSQSESFVTDCLSRASDSPRNWNGGEVQGAGAIAVAIGSRVAQAVRDCGTEADLLVPTAVFLKLIPQSAPSSPPSR